MLAPLNVGISLELTSQMPPSPDGHRRSPVVLLFRGDTKLSPILGYIDHG